MKKRVVAFNLFLLLAVSLQAFSIFRLPSAKALDVGGSILADTTWALSDSPYMVKSDVTVAVEATLTIEPGVTVKVSKGSSLTINGNLYAVGTDQDPIIFTSSEEQPAAGDWDGVKFYGNRNSTFRMTGCVLQHATNGITVASLGRVIIKETTISGNSLSGIQTTSGADLVIQDSTIDQNANGILSLGVTSYGLKIMNNQISNNENGIYINTYGDNSRIHNVTISGNTFKNNTNGVYLSSSASSSLANAFINNITISNNLMESNRYAVHLLAQAWGNPGLVGGGASIYNSVISNNRISFSDYAIHVNSTSNWYSWISSLEISRNIIHSSGNAIVCSAFRTPLPPLQDVPFDVTLVANTLSANKRGVSVTGDLRANFTSNSIAHNSYGIYLASSVESESVARSNDIYQNTAYGVYVHHNASIGAEHNYWGASNGPFHETLNELGQGDRVNGDGENLVFKPFSVEPFGTINNVPFAMLEIDPATIKVNQTVLFDGLKSYDDSSIIAYFFNYGDGETFNSSRGSSRHKYVSPGIYNASLVVMDDLGVSSTNVAIQAITVIYPSLVVSVSLNPLSVFSEGNSMIQIHVSEGDVSIDNALVQLASDQGGSFAASSGHTDSNGYFTSVYFVPSISEPVNIIITATASKEGYLDASEGSTLSVLTRPANGMTLDSVLPWLPVIAVAGLGVFVILWKIRKARRHPESKADVRKKPKRRRK